jgi:hypothetical protein
MASDSPASRDPDRAGTAKVGGTLETKDSPCARLTEHIHRTECPSVSTTATLMTYRVMKIASTSVNMTEGWVSAKNGGCGTKPSAPATTIDI